MSSLDQHPEDAERLFDAFYKTRGDGMGLGLSLSRWIIGRHGWADIGVGRRRHDGAGEPDLTTIAKSVDSKFERKNP